MRLPSIPLAKQSAARPRRARGTTAAVALLLAASSAPALSQSCSYNNNQPNTASFGTIDTTLTTPYTFSITLNYKCTGAVTPVFTVTGANDSGPGAYRLQNTTQPARYMSYSISTASEPGSKVTLNGLLVAASYQNAWAGSYIDTLTVLLLP